MKIALIVAASNNNVIGRNNELPWHLPKDLAYFKKVTSGSPILMGRKTYESIGFALPNRLNIIITRNTDYHCRDAVVVNSLKAAIDYAKATTSSEEIYIIGGATIFEEALPIIDKIYLNRVLAEIEGDTFLPEIDWEHWQLIHSEMHTADEKNQYPLSFEVYEKA